MSAKTVPSDRDIPEPAQQAVVRSSKRRNAVFMGVAEHVRLMKLMEEEDCEIFACSSTHSHSLASSNPPSLTEFDFEEECP
jgi:hypothetical protein